MARRPVSIRMGDDLLDWLGRNDRGVTEQLRLDLEEFRRLRRIGTKQPSMPISEAIDLASKTWMEK